MAGLLDLPDEVIEQILLALKGNPNERWRPRAAFQMSTPDRVSLDPDPNFHLLDARADHCNSLPLEFQSMYAVWLCNRKLHRIANAHVFSELPTYIDSNVAWISEIAQHIIKARTLEYHPQCAPIYYALDLVPQSHRHLIRSVLFSNIGGGGLPVKAQYLYNFLALPKIESITSSVQDCQSLQALDAVESKAKTLRLLGLPRDEPYLPVLLRMPVNLEELWIDATYLLGGTWDDFVTALLRYRLTLRKLTIVREDPPHERIRRNIEPLDLRQFPALQVLQVHEVFLFAEEPPDPNADFVWGSYSGKYNASIADKLPESLRSLSVYYDDGQYDDFDEKDFSWLIRLAEGKQRHGLQLQAVNMLTPWGFNNEDWETELYEVPLKFQSELEALVRAYQDAIIRLTIMCRVGTEGERASICIDDADYSVQLPCFRC